jgi:hypothetical protein
MPLELEFQPGAAMGTQAEALNSIEALRDAASETETTTTIPVGRWSSSDR